jgi:hypothetical protein
MWILFCLACDVLVQYAHSVQGCTGLGQVSHLAVCDTLHGTLLMLVSCICAVLSLQQHVQDPWRGQGDG